MATVKTLHHKHFSLIDFFDILAEITKLSKSHPKILELYQFGALTA